VEEVREEVEVFGQFCFITCAGLRMAQEESSGRAEEEEMGWMKGSGWLYS